MKWKLAQVGIVVKDMDKAIEFYSSAFGFGPFEIIEFPDLSVEVRGKPAKISVTAALAAAGDLQVEFIQAEPGENIYWEFFEKHGEGLHHLGFVVDDLDAELAEAKEKGIPVLMYGKVEGGSFAYLDSTQPGGVIMELLQQG